MPDFGRSLGRLSDAICEIDEVSLNDRKLNEMLSYSNTILINGNETVQKGRSSVQRFRKLRLLY